MSDRARIVASIAFVVSVLLAAAGQAGAAAPTAIPAFHVTGRVAVSEPLSCDGGNGDLTENALISWSECHALKQHMDAAGAPITIDDFDPDALRPLSVTVEIEVWCLYQGGTAGDPAPQATIRVQTDDTGAFDARVPRTRCGAAMPADSVVVRSSALLSFEMKAGGTTVGTIRALWDKTLGQTVYTSVRSADEPVVYSDGFGDWVTPRLELQFTKVPLPMPASVDLGNQTFFDGAVPDFYDYLRGALGAWQTTVALHGRIRDELRRGGHGALYAKMFITRPFTACTSCFSLGFNNPSGGGAGGEGSYSVDQPVPNPSVITYGGLVSIGLPAHELGHSMHATIAVGSFGAYDDTIAAMRTPQGTLTGGHFTYVGAAGTLQQQEMGIALTEGFGDAMGSFFLAGCRNPDRAWGNPDPATAMWNVTSYVSCDGTGTCPFEAFRFQMWRRGIAEGSATWNARLAELTALAQAAVAAGAINVITNNELKLRGFFCDLLDKDRDVSFAAGQIAGKTYVADLTWHAAERLDGRTPPVVLKTYASDPQAERVHLTLGQLLTAMDEFVVGLHGPNPPIPPALFADPSIVDGANQFYDDTRISVNGPLSPQTLGLYLVQRGDLTKTALNGILRANRMDEVP